MGGGDTSGGGLDVKGLFQNNPELMNKLANSNIDPKKILDGLSKQEGAGLARTMPVQPQPGLDVQPLPPILPAPGAPAITSPVSQVPPPEVINQARPGGFDPNVMKQLQQLMQRQQVQAPNAPMPQASRAPTFNPAQLPAGPARQRPTLSQLLGG